MDIEECAVTLSSREETGIVTAYLTDMQVRREEVTLTTATGKTHTIRLLKQSDIFGE